jgi:hypothetical protein
VALLVMAILIAYWNSFAGDFQYDDYNVIVFNPAVHSISAWAASMPGIRPLLKLSYTLNWIVSPQPFGFHLFNLALHMANTVMVYFLLRQLSSSNAMAGQRPFPTIVAFTASLLFAIHPVQTEAVTYISSRSVALMASFYLGSMLAYIHGSASGAKGWLYLVSPLMFALAVLTKEVALTLPFTLLLWDRLCPQQTARWVDILRKQALHWLVFLATLIGALLHPTYQDLLAVSLSERDTYQNLLSQINGVVYLLSRLIWVHQLNIDPDLPIITALTPLLIIKALSIAGLIVVGLAYIKRKPWLAMGIFWFFLQLAPTNSLLPRLDVANERQLYLANVGIFLIVAIGLFHLLNVLSNFQRLIVQTGAILIAAALIVSTIQRNRIYEYQVDLWQDTLKNSPGKARVHNNLGFALATEGDHDGACSHFRTALALKPGYALAKRNLAAQGCH